MKIALIGYGKMGRMIEEVALERGHEISARIDADNRHEFDSEAFRTSDVAIEFTRPNAAVDNLRKAFAASVPVVCGTTGWYDSLPEFRSLCDQGKASLIAASNFSIGVNIFMDINRRLARIMKRFPQYEARMEEVHHIHKLDHPSGTAITLAEEIIEESGRYNGWHEALSGESAEPSALPIAARRQGEVPGIHSITWDSDVDSITITHDAKSRRGFALGAVVCAEYLAANPGWHTVSEALGLSDL